MHGNRRHALAGAGSLGGASKASGSSDTVLPDRLEAFGKNSDRHGLKTRSSPRLLLLPRSLIETFNAKEFLSRVSSARCRTDGMMEHSRVRSVARAGFLHGEQYEETTQQNAQDEEPEQTGKGNARSQLEVKEGIEDSQGVQNGCKTQDRPQTGASQKDSGQEDGDQKGGEQEDAFPRLRSRSREQGRLWRGQLHYFPRVPSGPNPIRTAEQEQNSGNGRTGRRSARWQRRQSTQAGRRNGTFAFRGRRRGLKTPNPPGTIPVGRFRRW